MKVRLPISIKHAVVFFGIVFFPASAVFADAFVFSANRQVIARGESATLSWNAEKSETCDSFVDLQNELGQWVWSFSDEWQATGRAKSGTATVSPIRNARYYLVCAVKGKREQQSVEISITGTPIAQTGDMPIKKETQAPLSAPSVSQPSVPIQPVSVTPIIPDAQKQPASISFPSAQKVEKNEKTDDAKPASPEKEKPVAISAQAQGERVLSLAEARAEFRLLYGRIASPYDSRDRRAVRILSGGEQIRSRILSNEKKAVQRFKQAAKRIPSTTQEWRRVHSFAYAGVKAKKDSDKDFLADEDERRFRTNPKKADTDEDGYLDGLEIENNYGPLTKKPIKLKFQY